MTLDFYKGSAATITVTGHEYKSPSGLGSS
jgi:hypothetical protein